MAAADTGDSTTRVPAGIVPRWEWRTFGDHFGRAEELAGGSPERQRSSDELYVLSERSEASVKVRDGLMDVKHRLVVDDDGLELWTPVLQAAFPLSRDDTEKVLRTLGIAGAALPREEYSWDELVGDLLGPRPEVRVVDVHKQRAHYLVDGCSVELTTLTADGATTRTLTVESPDPAAVTAVVGKLGLAERPNVSVARGIKALVGFGAPRHAVIDVGTNSVKFHVGQRHADGSVQVLVDRADTTRLGEGQEDSGVLAEEAIERTVEAIVAMVDEARHGGPVEIVAVGTAGLRRAPNKARLVDAVRERTAVVVEVISGEEEARLAYLAATSALPTSGGPLVVFDSGGGSTQFTFGHDDQVDEQFSVDIGAVRVAERFGLAAAVSAETLGEALAWLSTELAALDDRSRPDAVIAIGGTATNLASVRHGLAEYDPDVVHGTVIDRAELDRQIERYRSLGADERRAIPGLQPARAEVILGGACIVRTIFDKLGHDSVTVSDRGLRHGVVIGRFSS